MSTVFISTEQQRWDLLKGMRIRIDKAKGIIRGLPGKNKDQRISGPLPLSQARASAPRDGFGTSMDQKRDLAMETKVQQMRPKDGREEGGRQTWSS